MYSALISGRNVNFYNVEAIEPGIYSVTKAEKQEKDAQEQIQDPTQGTELTFKKSAESEIDIILIQKDKGCKS